LTLASFSTILTHGVSQRPKRDAVTVMAKLPPKKEPKMTVASERTGRAQDNFELEASSLARKTHAAIEAARSKMTDTEREEADGKARAILERSSASSSERQRSA
jgi:hypothetical protein